MFRVEWLAEALAELAAIRVGADSTTRRSLTDASHSLDRDLQAAPDLLGESRGDTGRVVFAHPLALWVEVDRERRLVSVLHAWQIRRRGE